MKIELGKRFWLALTAAILILTFFVVGRNFLHAVRINRQINRLEREAEMYRARIAPRLARLHPLLTAPSSKRRPGAASRSVPDKRPKRTHRPVRHRAERPFQRMI